MRSLNDASNHPPGAGRDGLLSALTDRLQAASILLLLASVAVCQSTLATITGIVTDQEGAVIANVAIEVVHNRTGYRFKTTSNEVGLYTIPQLPDGEYTLSARAPGFQEAVVRDILLAQRDIRRVDLKLDIAKLQQTIEVSAGATLIETESARISDTKSVRLLSSLPYAGRGAFMIFQLTPNVTRVKDVYVMRFAGSRLNQSDYSLDGISFMVTSGSNPNAPLTDYMESFQEIRVDVANNTAEFGTIGQVSIISKSGTNQLHGSVFDFYRTPFFRARSTFALARPAGVGHQPGYTLGGPVYLPRIYDGRNRTFFFSTMELNKSSVSTGTLAATVPAVPWRAGDFSLLLTAVNDPLGGNAPFPGNRIPASRLNPVSLKIQERFYPLPTEGDPNTHFVNNFRKLYSMDSGIEWYFTEKLDHRISDKAFLTGRLVRHGYNAYRVTSQLGGREPTLIQWRTRFYYVSYTHTFKPTVVNEFRAGYAFNVNPRYPKESGLALVRELGLVGLHPNLPDYPGIFNVSFQNITMTGVSNSLQYRPARGNNNFYVQDHWSWFRGRHALKAGFQVSHHWSIDRFLNNDLYGSVTFSNRFTNHPWADFLLGIPSSSSRAMENMEEHEKRRGYSGFITDEFRPTTSLTLNLGVRYEYEPGWYGNDMATFSPALAKIVVPDENMKLVSPLVPASYVQVIPASQAGLPIRTLVFADRNNFAPRIGVAWRPFGPHTVFRAGWGMFYDLVPRNLTVAGGSPYSITEPAYTNPRDAPTVILPRVFPETGTGSPTTITIPSATNPYLRTPYSFQYNVTVEHQRWSTGFRISYIGTGTRQGEWGYNMNQPVPDARLFIHKLNERPFPRYPNIFYYTNGAGH
ncbi:MAG: carboxypeptidase-like regulatory domain-containing protein [Bryobacterales bacterium]|nr:carboxypeptidase-like regulatory domain-containing protein [Bryobacteraceae bacterium]MDW8129679.1 carboxypeptidase-like regulatory domain-containing protein [Bryobacterales bacterium]